MAYNQQSAFGIPSTWRELNASAIELLFTMTLLIGAASFVLMASGEPEMIALVALTGVTVVLLGTALVRISKHLRTAEASFF